MLATFRGLRMPCEQALRTPRAARPRLWGQEPSATLGGLARVAYTPRDAWGRGAGTAVYAVMATDPSPKGLPCLQRDYSEKVLSNVLVGEGTKAARAFQGGAGPQATAALGSILGGPSRLWVVPPAPGARRPWVSAKGQRASPLLSQRTQR